MEKLHGVQANDMIISSVTFSLLSFLFTSLAGSVSSLLLLLTSHPAQFPEQFGLSYSVALGSPIRVSESIRADGSF